MADAETKAEIQ